MPTNGSCGAKLGSPVLNPSRVQIVGGDAPQNGLIGSQFFVDGAEVAATYFFSSAYDPQYHTADGIVLPNDPDADIQYAPQLSGALIDLLKQPHTLVIDGEISALDSTKFYLLCDESVYFQYQIDLFAILVADNNAFLSEASFGLPTPTIGRYRMAITKTDELVTASVNGSAIASDTADSMPYGAITTVVLGLRNGAKITEFTIYATPVADADLPALSAL